MRRVIFYFIVLIFAIWIGLKAHADSGYVLVSYGHWTVETSLWFALAVLFFTIFIIHFLFRLWRKGISFPKKIRNHLSNRKKDHDFQIATGLIQADTYMQNAQFEGAISKLKHVRTIAPKNISALRKLAEVYTIINDKDGLSTLLPEIKKHIQKEWNTTLSEYYFKASDSDVNKQIKQAKKWLKTHPNDPTLLRIMAGLCIKQTLWGQARDYLEKALTITENSTLFSMLGHVHEQLDKQEKAIKYYRRAYSAFS